MPTATVTSKGQITIPVEVRKKLGLKAGDQIDFFEGEGGEISFEPKTGSIKDMEGILQRLGYAPLGAAPTIEEMDNAVVDAVAKDFLRSVQESEIESEHAKAS